MTTICSKCGKEIKETSDKYCMCPRCSIYVPKGANSYKGKTKLLKEGKIMATKIEATKAKPMSVQVKNLLAENKSIEEINQITGIKVSYILAVKKKKEKLEQKK
jgi:hypothetical protein